MVKRTPKDEAAEPVANITSDQMRAGNNFADNQLLSFVERIERLAEEKAALAEDIKEVFGEVKSMGFDTKILRKVLSRRRMDTTSRKEMDALMELYEESVGRAEKRQVAQSVEEGA